MSRTLKLPTRLPLFPIQGCILLPGTHLPLNVFEPRYLNMVDDALQGDPFIGMIQPRDSGPKAHPNLEEVGCAGMIASHSETDDGRYLIVLEGIVRFDRIGERSEPRPYRVSDVRYDRFSADLTEPEDVQGAKREAFMATLKSFFIKAGIEADFDELDEAPLGLVADKVAMAAPFDPMTKQSILEAETGIDRISLLKSTLDLYLQTDGSSRQ